ncbi:MAG: helicase-exonuclease AddAB subunit AddB [Firmicutes bacterium]|nr:helicase-exonuclease AddAB subunit AddB [Bacillota bacterium]
MALRFILGRAGSGKTALCLAEIARLCREEPLGAPLIFLVPEQATFETEKELALLCGGGTFRAEILSFRRMAWRLRAMGRDLPHISETGRHLVLRRLLQEKHGDFTVFGRVARQPRFCEQLAKQLREFKYYKVEPETLQRLAAAPACPPQLQGKLADLAAVFSAYKEFIAGKFSDPEDALDELAEAISGGALPFGTRVWVDGFAGFTPQEYAVLGAMLSAAAEVNIALCLDPAQLRPPREDDLFQPTMDTYHRLLRLAAKLDVAVLSPQKLPVAGAHTRFADSRPLAHLEKHFAALPPVVWTGAAEEIRLVTTTNPRAEVEAVACDIVRLTREKGWRYRDMAVILRNFDSYHDLVAAVFTDFDIPFYVDERRPAVHHPLIEFLRSALEAVSGNFPPAAVFRLLKTDFLPLSREAADSVENYARAHGIRGKYWFDEQAWNLDKYLTWEEGAEAKDDTAKAAEKIGESMRILRDTLAPFAAACTGGGKQPAAAYCLALWQLMERVDIGGSLQRWVREAEAAGFHQQALEHRQIYNGVVDLLEQAYTILGDQAMTFADFVQVVLAGLENLKPGLLPATTDRVMIGSVERSRQPRLRAAYVLGLNEGEFPARQQEEGLFADHERELLGDIGVELALGRKQRQYQEQYLAYIALTRSSQYLWLSCPLADEEGKAKRPSPVFRHVREMFPRNRVLFVGNNTDDTSLALARPQQAAGGLLLAAGQAVRGGKLPPFWAAVYEEARRHEETATLMAKLWPALTWRNAVQPLSPAAAAALFGRTLRTSVSRLEEFASCPFAHFARYGLQLQEREEANFDAGRMGVFYHTALKLLVAEMLAEGAEWASLSTDEVCSRMERVVASLLPQLQQEVVISEARLKFLGKRLQETLTEAAAVLTVHARRSAFRPVAVELAFGRDAIPPWSLEAQGRKVLLYGQIDRIDMAEAEDKKYVRVLDYKSSPTRLLLSDLYHGLSLQLLAYLAALLDVKEILPGDAVYPAGAFYFGISRPFARTDNPPPDGQKEAVRLEGLLVAEKEVFDLLGGEELVPAALNKDGTFSKYSRVVTEVEMRQLLAFAKRKILALAGRIQNGDIGIAPYKKKDGRHACSFCPYGALCCFELSLPGNYYRMLPSYSQAEVLAAISAGEGRESLDNQVD